MSSSGLVLFRGALILSMLLWWGTQPHASLAHGLSKGTTLGRAPANCPATPTPQRFHPQVFGPGVGSAPVWAVIGGDQSAVIPTEPHSTTSPGHTRYGWGMKILWALAPGTTDVVRLHGWNLATGARVHFDLQGVEKVGRLDPRLGGSGMDGWGGFPSEEYFPSAGCYVLFAQWRTGSWMVAFAFGR